ncbi:sorting nexin-25 isoform X2 [Zootermopsis nevadensis]|uniref:sorting nexin-25 isoform X2 n=1 Tax=Zootermopsis nevadensis TaxID=136037 RepID=UPI000B8E5661|nr:sorting nexin-25 isoform X2 [Zootermopsis nevadensis]
MKPLFIVSTLGALFLAVIYLSEWLSTFLIIGGIFVIAVGLAILVTAHLSLVTRSTSSIIYTKPTPELEAMHKYLTELEPKLDGSVRLPVIFGRMIDGILQQLLDLILRDYVGAWCNEAGFKSDELIQDLKVDLWHVTKNLQERLSKIDQARLVAVDMVNVVTKHFERIRLAQPSATDGKLVEFNLSTHLTSSARERDYLRRVSERCIALLFPPNYIQNSPVKHLLREILACKVFYPVINIMTDPDSINQKILTYIQQQPESETLRKKTYAYAASFEDFIKMIKDSNDTEVLKHIRYNIVTEIMQATTIHNLKKSKGLNPDKEVFSFGTGKGDMLQARQVKRYINQLTYAKCQCENRLRLLGWMGYPVEEAVEASTMITRKILTLPEVLESVVGRRYLTQFLEQIGSASLMGYWSAVEELRQSDRFHWHQLGAEIFYTYINTPSPDIRVDKPVLKKMEGFLLGDKGPEVFYEVQEEVIKTLEEKFYPSFIVSDLYQKMQTAMEEASNSEKDDPAESQPMFDSSGLGRENSTLHVVDQSNYARRKLDQLQEKLNNKMQALQALRTSLKPESRVLVVLEKEVEQLQGEKCQLEAHLTRTEAWGEHLGQWRAVVQSAELSEDKELLQFVLVVHILEDVLDNEGISTGWVVLRTLSDFQELHRKLCHMNSRVKSLELPSQPLKFRFGKGTSFLEKAKMQIHKYLKFVLEDDRLNQSEALYTFLSPSSAHLKQASPSPKKSKFSLSTLFKSAEQIREASTSGSAARDSDEEDVTLLLDDNEVKSLVSGESGMDGIAEPLYNLLGEVFDLHGVFKWLRKTLITFVQITYGRTINRQVCETVSWLFSEPMMYYYIKLLIKSWWPNGKLMTASSPRTEEEKMSTRCDAREQFLNNIPEVLSNLVGQQSARRGAMKVFETLQDPRLNKQLFYDLFEMLLFELCPELKDQ